LNFALLVPAAGSGERLGFDVPKALLALAGEALFARAVRPFLSFADCREVVIAAPPEYLAEFERAAKELRDSRVRVIAGGATRQDSVGLALDAVSEIYDAVIVHDAARPFVTRELIEAVFAGLDDDTAAVLPGLPATDTLKLVKPGSLEVAQTLARARIYSVQTPQLLRMEIFRAAHRKARERGMQASDDVALIEEYGLGKVQIVPGDERNIKLTTPADLERARSFLKTVAATAE
jgi:2-C-methyl-D-erythritol 4-phosphate cytidylyltransferase